MWRKLFKVFGAIVVMTIDFDGEVRFRFAKKISEDELLTTGIIENVLLYKDGTTSKSYIKKWRYL